MNMQAETWEALSAFAGVKLARAALKPGGSCRAADTRCLAVGIWRIAVQGASFQYTVRLPLENSSHVLLAPGAWL